MKIINRLTRSIPTLLALSALSFVGSNLVVSSTRAAQLTSCGPVTVSNAADDRLALATASENGPTSLANGAGQFKDATRTTRSSVGGMSISRAASVRNDMNLMSIY